jgi:hypothetical protein
MEKSAPDFSDSMPYPSAGKIIGPAWEYTWNRIGRLTWNKKRLIKDVVEARGNIAPRTVENLLSQAHREGLLGIRYAVMGGRKTAFYFRTDVELLPWAG